MSKLTEIREQCKRVTAWRVSFKEVLEGFVPGPSKLEEWAVKSANALPLALDMLEKIAAQPRHGMKQQIVPGGYTWESAPCDCIRCETAREVDATLEAIKAEFL